MNGVVVYPSKPDIKPKIVSVCHNHVIQDVSVNTNVMVVSVVLNRRIFMVMVMVQDVFNAIQVMMVFVLVHYLATVGDIFKLSCHLRTKVLVNV